MEVLFDRVEANTGTHERARNSLAAYETMRCIGKTALYQEMLREPLGYQDPLTPLVRYAQDLVDNGGTVSNEVLHEIMDQEDTAVVENQKMAVTKMRYKRVGGDFVDRQGVSLMSISEKGEQVSRKKAQTDSRWTFQNKRDVIFLDKSKRRLHLEKGQANVYVSAYAFQAEAMHGADFLKDEIGYFTDQKTSYLYVDLIDENDELVQYAVAFENSSLGSCARLLGDVTGVNPGSTEEAALLEYNGVIDGVSEVDIENRIEKAAKNYDESLEQKKLGKKFRRGVEVDNKPQVDPFTFMRSEAQQDIYSFYYRNFDTLARSAVTGRLDASLIQFIQEVIDVDNEYAARSGKISNFSSANYSQLTRLAKTGIIRNLEELRLLKRFITYSYWSAISVRMSRLDQQKEAWANTTEVPLNTQPMAQYTDPYWLRNAGQLNPMKGVDPMPDGNVMKEAAQALAQKNERRESMSGCPGKISFFGEKDVLSEDESEAKKNIFDDEETMSCVKCPLCGQITDAKVKKQGERKVICCEKCKKGRMYKNAQDMHGTDLSKDEVASILSGEEKHE